jgi:hypothetical protein
MPSEEPPSWVTKTTLWRLAMCVLRDHAIAGTGVIDACARCFERWPCTCRTLAERALAEAGRPPRPRRVRNQEYLDLLRERAAGRSINDP